jgi:hypothetical protein
MSTNQATYLYCFARTGAICGLEAVGVDGCPGVEAIEVGETAAVCSPVSLDEFPGDDAEDPRRGQPPDPEWLIPRACRHEKVIEQVMARSPVLPVRFGAVFSSPEAVKAVLARQEPRIARFLADAEEKEEWAVKGFIDGVTAKVWLLDSDSALVARRQLLPASPGKRYFQEKRLLAAAQQQVKSWGRTVATEVHAALQDVAVESRPLKLQPSHLTGKPGEMVLNVAFFLPRNWVAEFRAQVERVGARYEAQGLTLECTGPWPPFSFCPSLEEPTA